eukprot:SAG31_NODE_5862_length_2285_cov_1.425435_3_plen_68_part_00
MTHTDKFERNNLDQFLVEVPFLGDIQRCSIRHDGWGKLRLGDAWHLDRITVCLFIFTSVTCGCICLS